MTAEPDDLHPEIRAFRDFILGGYAGQGEARDRDHRRQIAEAVRAPLQQGGPAMARTDHVIVAGRRLVIHRPVESEAALPVLVYLHGGGWVLFSIDTHDRLMREYAARSGFAVLGVDYSLSPEAAYPQALNDIDAAIDWLERDGAAHGLDASRWLIGGDSAGANLSLGTTLRRRDKGQSLPRGMVLNYGAFDDLRRASHEQYGGDRYMLTPDEMTLFWADYAQGRFDDPYVRPLLGDLTGLPPAHMAIAACDILADENREMAARLAAAGVPTDVREYAGASHSFLEASATSSIAREALDAAAAWMRTRVD
ncbi:MAG: alpha/beta hydrolase [Brevundimonas sp.]|nr:MAG: alpha/beta hydrolase [Brevundimonas sp.]